MGFTKKDFMKYLDLFSDNAKIYMIIANPQKRKLYPAEGIEVIADSEFPIVGITVGDSKDMDEVERAACEEAEKQVQPEFPVLKNNEQRKAWLKDYKTWPIWFENLYASETYYRYDLPDGYSIAICEYGVYHEWKKQFNEDPNTVIARCYLLKPNYHYLHDCKASETELIDHLKKLGGRK